MRGEHMTHRELKRRAIAAIVVATMIMPAGAVAGDNLQTAESIRKLDIMLMVTSLRCRMGKDDFQPEYRKFTATHLSTLNLAGQQLRSNLQRSHGSKGAMRALDKMSVGMANQYGQGHPWLGCAELKTVTQNLSKERDPLRLASAAGELLHPRRGTNLAYLDK